MKNAEKPPTWRQKRYFVWSSFEMQYHWDRIVQRVKEGRARNVKVVCEKPVLPRIKLAMFSMAEELGRISVNGRWMDGVNSKTSDLRFIADRHHHAAVGGNRDYLPMRLGLTLWNLLRLYILHDNGNAFAHIETLIVAIGPMLFIKSMQLILNAAGMYPVSAAVIESCLMLITMFGIGVAMVFYLCAQVNKERQLHAEQLAREEFLLGSGPLDEQKERSIQSLRSLQQHIHDHEKPQKLLGITANMGLFTRISMCIVAPVLAGLHRVINHELFALQNGRHAHR